MPLTKEQKEIFEQLRRIKDREYAQKRRDKHRKRKYTPRTTRKN